MSAAIQKYLYIRVVLMLSPSRFKNLGVGGGVGWLVEGWLGKVGWAECANETFPRNRGSILPGGIDQMLMLMSIPDRDVIL